MQPQMDVLGPVNGRKYHNGNTASSTSRTCQALLSPSVLTDATALVPEQCLTQCRWVKVTSLDSGMEALTMRSPWINFTSMQPPLRNTLY